MSATPIARLLVVDDEAAHMKALCHTLETEGYSVKGFRSARDALMWLKAGDFDLLVTDLQMPEMDGIALLNAARAIDVDLAGVVMTGHATIDTAVQAMQVGALDYVRKPFRLNVILSVITRALGVRRLRLENARLLAREREYVTELEVANRDLESFAFSVSHDLRAPLRAVTGFCEMYLERFGASVPADGRRLLDQVVSGSQRMDQLIEALLRFSRLSRQPLLKRSVDLDPLVRRVSAELEAHVLAQEPTRRVEVRIAQLPMCEGDAALLEQVFVNLLSNAFKFTRGQAIALIEVGCGTARSAVNSSAQDTRDALVVYVSDNGAGFDMQHAQKLFGVFQRLHSTEEFEGTGVGLSVVKRIVERHGGRIWAEAQVGRGATFFVGLPG